MEQGRDVSGRKLMQFLDFYSHYISIDNLFGEKFDLIEEENISLLFDKTSIDVIMKSKLNNSIKRWKRQKAYRSDFGLHEIKTMTGVFSSFQDCAALE